jgi:hypothetical protein
MNIWVLLLHPRTDQEGIYTLQVQGENVVVSFEEEDDAVRCADYLAAQDFSTLQPEAIAQDEIEEFCEAAGYRLMVVPAGELFVPPEQNLERTDYDLQQDTVPEADQTGEAFLIEQMRRRLENLL